MAKDRDGLLFVEFVEGACRNFAHRNKSAAGNLRGLELPWLTNIQEKRRVFGSELLFQLVDGDFKIHKKTVEGRR